MDRVFLDANILFSAAYSQGAGLARLWEISDIRLLTSAYAAEEARRNLDLGDQIERLDVFVSKVELVVASQEMAPNIEQTRLPEKDVPILLAAVAGQATHLLTGDLRHFGHLLNTQVHGVLIQLPAVYLRGSATKPS